MQHIQSILLSILLTAIIVACVSYYFFYEDCQVDLIDARPATLWDERPDGEPLVTNDAQHVATGTLSYYIPEMGVRFEYPAYATVTMRVLEGTSGQKLVGTIYLSPSDKISFGGMTEDFLWPKGCDQFCGVGGFSKIGTQYYFGINGTTDRPIEMPEVIITRDGITEAVMVLSSRQDGPGELAVNTAEILLNTNNPRFPAIGFIGRVDTLEARARFESIIRSIEVE